VKAKPLPATGKIEGTILAHTQTLKMFDGQVGITVLHFSYDLETKFCLDGKPAHAEDIRRNMQCVVHYHRDKFGRIIASKVELFSRPRA